MCYCLFAADQQRLCAQATTQSKPERPRARCLLSRAEVTELVQEATAVRRVELAAILQAQAEHTGTFRQTPNISALLRQTNEYVVHCCCCCCCVARACIGIHARQRLPVCVWLDTCSKVQAAQSSNTPSPRHRSTRSRLSDARLDSHSPASGKGSMASPARSRTFLRQSSRHLNRSVSRSTSRPR